MRYFALMPLGRATPGVGASMNSYQVSGIMGSVATTVVESSEECSQLSFQKI
jgi:hypothetical protein